MIRRIIVRTYHGLRRKSRSSDFGELDISYECEVAVAVTKDGLWITNTAATHLGSMRRGKEKEGASNTIQDVLEAARQLGLNWRPEQELEGNRLASDIEFRIASHPTKQIEILVPAIPQATSSPPCASCSEFLSLRAQFDAQRRPRVVDDPYGTTIYYPDGAIEVIAKRTYPERFLGDPL